jgi:hypothetical protein
MKFNSRYKPVGWQNESHRHFLAAKGIKTKIKPMRFFEEKNTEEEEENMMSSVHSLTARGIQTRPVFDKDIEEKNIPYPPISTVSLFDESEKFNEDIDKDNLYKRKMEPHKLAEIERRRNEAEVADYNKKFRLQELIKQQDLQRKSAGDRAARRVAWIKFRKRFMMTKDQKDIGKDVGYRYGLFDVSVIDRPRSGAWMVDPKDSIKSIRQTLTIKDYERALEKERKEKYLEGIDQ